MASQWKLGHIDAVVGETQLQASAAFQMGVPSDMDARVVYRRHRLHSVLRHEHGGFGDIGCSIPVDSASIFGHT